MNLILEELLNKFCIVYIDDIIVYSDNIELYLEHLHQVFEALTYAGLKLGFNKYIFL